MSAAASAYNHSLEPLDKRISKYIGGAPIRVDGKPRASGVMDTVNQILVNIHPCTDSCLPQIRAALAHGLKVPPEFEEKSVVDVIVSDNPQLYTRFTGSPKMIRIS